MKPVRIIAMLSMLILIANLAYAQTKIELSSPADNFAQSNSNARFTFNVSSGAEVSSCSLILNNNIDSTTTSITLNQTNYFDKILIEGYFNWSINCTQNGNIINSSTYKLTIDTSNPTVILNYPADKLQINRNNLIFNYTPTDVNLKNCTLFANSSGIWQAIQTNLSPATNLENKFTVTLGDGAYKWNVKCLDKASLEGWSSLNYTLTIDATPPTILSYTPTSQVTSSDTTLTVTTNENAVCRYSTTSSINYSSMNQFSTTGLKTHTQSLLGLTDSTYNYNYYIKCNDSLGNIGEDYLINFEVSLLPSAEIALSDASPIKAGTIEVKLTTTKKLRSAPTLYYTFDTDSSSRYISLTGADTNWIGYMIIEDKNEKKIGTFYFSGTDIKGNTGTTITNGRLFIVDTIEPNIPTNIVSSSEQNGEIKLKWYYEDEDVDHYEIYRTTSSGVSYLDNYASTNEPQFIDKSIIEKVTYYYKIAVVDKAGNKGLLSGEVYATSVKTGPQQITTPETSIKTSEPELPKPLPPNLVPKVENSIKSVDNLLIDINYASSNLQENADNEKKLIIDDLKLIIKIKDAESKLNEIKVKLSDLKSTYRTEGELDNELTKIGLEIKKIEKTIPKDLNLIEKTEFVQSISQEDIDKAVNEIAKKISMTEDEKRAYINNNKKTHEKINVEVKISIVSIDYLDDNKEEKTLVQKKIFHNNPEPFKDVVIVEIIPKDIVENVNDIAFITADYEIINEDPVVKFGFLEFNYDGTRIEYIVNRKIDLATVKRAKSIVLLGLNQQVKKSVVTGFSIFSFNGSVDNTQKAIIGIGILIIVGLVAYYFAFAKGYTNIFSKISPKRNDTKGRQNREIHIQSIDPLTNFDAGSLDYGKDSDFLLHDLNRYVKSVKVDIADKLYPAITTIHKMLETRKNMQSENKHTMKQAKELIAEIEYYIENNEHNRASMLYPTVEMIYQQLPKEHKAEIYDRCVELHRRINENR